MKTAKQAQPKKSTRFLLDHEPRIVGGHYEILVGWLKAGQECIGKFDGNASEYARCSLSANVGNGNTKHSQATIRQFVGVAVTALTKYDTINGVCEALVSEKHGNRVFPSMLDVRALLAGNGQRATGNKVAKKFNAKKQAEKFTKAQLQAMLATK
jgi:hypothetical protein